jgi:hypothetical protein
MTLSLPFLRLVLTLVKINLTFNQKKKKTKEVNIILVSKVLLMTFNI